MKYVINLFLALILIFSACTGESINPDTEVPVDPTEPEAPVDKETSTPCDYDFNSTSANDTLIIECSHDLNGQKIMLPENVIIDYKGGEIINGELNFKQAGIIDGRLLNHQLGVTGSVKLNSSTYTFDKNKWGIVEGIVSDEIALDNKNLFQRAINDVKRLGAINFNIDQLDAYFLVTSDRNLVLPFETSIHLPSNFNLKMADNANLRVQPNKYVRYNLLEIRGQSNVTITGGKLHGDRDKHDYTPIYDTNGRLRTTHEWGHLINISSGVDITISDVIMQNAAGDGLNIHSMKYAFDPEYIGSNNVLVTGCTFDSNRRNNMSITDGYNIIVENNSFLNAGVDTQYSEGTSPKCGIDVEAYRTRDDNGNLIEYQIAKDITIRNNIEKGSMASAFTIAIGQDITIENNTTENTIGFSLANGVRIINNVINAQADDVALKGGKPQNSETIFNNEISGNTVNSGNLGISIYNQDIDVYDNIIKNCKTGIMINDIIGSNIYGNKISSDVTNSYGIFTHIASADKVQIYENDINTTFKPIAFVNVNIEQGTEANQITLSNNELNGGEVSISNSNGIIVN
ncbi:hypothetical protein [Carboxylicivirga sp. RSCT41]|uniref:hypothetical protein n=1 Tax=Carboxylicivirga agarovorans TaxID=3417570 RepID=UPI003D32F9C5